MADTGRGRKPIKRGADQRMVDGKNFRLADEVRYILGRAAEHDGRVITIGQIILFSTETGDAWLIEPSDQLAARLARDGRPPGAPRGTQRLPVGADLVAQTRPYACIA